MIELTIAIPAYHMEACLAQNLSTYLDGRLLGRVEILVLNNSSTDRTGAIAAQYAVDHPGLFTAIDKPNRGYGSSVNRAILEAKGRYFRVIDADDFVNTDQLVLFVQQLAEVDADVVETPFTIVQSGSGQRNVVSLPTARQLNCSYPICEDIWQTPFPCLHSTTFRTELLQSHQIQLLEDTYFVDEELMIRPFQYGSTVCYLPYNVYCYVVGEDGQSTSPQNRMKYQDHRRRVIDSVLEAGRDSGCPDGPRAYCAARIQAAIGDHLTTLLMYETDRVKGRRSARAFVEALDERGVTLSQTVRRKYQLLSVANRLSLSLDRYEQIKRVLLGNQNRREQTL